MLTRIGTITVQVTDQDKALDYYVNRWGFEKCADMPIPGRRWLEEAPPQAQTRILLYKATPNAPGAGSYEEAKARIGKNTGMVMETDYIVKTFADLKAKGVVIVDEPRKQPYGWWGVFADQNGNSYGVHQ
jgi:lactoylglutathione lyase